MTIEKFIDKAIEGGWKPFGSILHKNLIEKKWAALEVMANFYHQPTFLLDPKMWEAVGKVEGWVVQEVKNADFDVIGLNYKYEYKMHDMIDALIAGKTLEEYIQTL